jgi:hypothetical protein
MLPGQTDVLLMMDEAHLLLTSDDVLLFSTSRSLGLMPVIAVQGHDSLINTYGSENEADLLANTMQSVIALNHSFVTRNYLMKRLGKAQLTTFKEPTRVASISRGLTNFRHSVLNDPNHPYAAAYEQMLMQGAGRLSALRVDPATGRKWRVGAEDTVGQEELARDIDMPTGGKREVLPLFLEGIPGPDRCTRQCDCLALPGRREPHGLGRDDAQRLSPKGQGNPCPFPKSINADLTTHFLEGGLYEQCPPRCLERPAGRSR